MSDMLDNSNTSQNKKYSDKILEKVELEPNDNSKAKIEVELSNTTKVLTKTYSISNLAQRLTFSKLISKVSGLLADKNEKKKDIPQDFANVNETIYKKIDRLSINKKTSAKDINNIINVLNSKTSAKLTDLSKGFSENFQGISYKLALNDKEQKNKKIKTNEKNNDYILSNSKPIASDNFDLKLLKVKRESDFNTNLNENKQTKELADKENIRKKIDQAIMSKYQNKKGFIDINKKWVVIKQNCIQLPRIGEMKKKFKYRLLLLIIY